MISLTITKEKFIQINGVSLEIPKCAIAAVREHDIVAHFFGPIRTSSLFRSRRSGCTLVSKEKAKNGGTQTIEFLCIVLNIRKDDMQVERVNSTFQDGEQLIHLCQLVRP